MPQLNEMPYPMKGAMYWPSSALTPTWWREWIAGTVTDADINADLDLLVSTKSNTVRVIVPYDNPSGGWGFTDGAGNHNAQALNFLVRFIGMAKAKGLFVVPNIFQEMEVIANGGFSVPALIKNKAHHESFIRWFMASMNGLDNVPVVIIKNEPDGYGVWANEDDRHTVIGWLVDMYAAAKHVAPNIRLSSVTSTHDNLFVESLKQPVGQQSIYDIVDVVMWNSFHWCDNGYWQYQVPANWLQYVVDRNVQNKPMVLSEFGWPSHYDETGVVVPNQQFDKPIGLRPKTPSTEDTQMRAYAETIAWVEMFTAQERGLHGALAWSLIDKPQPSTTYYREPFGMFNADRTPKKAVKWFDRLYTNHFTDDGRLWQPITRAHGDASVNGRDGTVGPPAGALILNGRSLSVQAIARIPIGIEYEIKFTAVPAADGVALLNNISGGSAIHVRREEYYKRWRLFYDNVEVATTANNSTVNLVIGQTYRFKVEIGVYRGGDQYGVDFYVDDVLIPWVTSERFFFRNDLLTVNPNPGLFITGIEAGLSELELYSIQLVRLLTDTGEQFRPAVPDDLSTPWLDRYQH